VLTRLRAPVPAIAEIDEDAGRVRFERIEGTHPGSDAELHLAAWALGNLHRRAMAAAGEVDGDVASLEPFWPRRTQVLPQRIASTAQALLTADDVEQLYQLSAALPLALYKDNNCRNVLLGDGDAVWLVDFDDLTLAPIGYDLAKLVVSVAMTQARRPDLDGLSATYIDALGAPVDLDSFTASVLAWCAMHDVLTARYIGHNGYRARWPQVITAADRAATRDALHSSA
jgi:hypothetical protein